jgi:two-component system response regulator AtoC
MLANADESADEARRASILVVEDEPRSQRIIARLLQQRGYEVDVAGTAQEALRLIEDNAYDVTLVDYQLPDLMGHELVEQARIIEPLMEFVGMSGYGNPAVAQNLMNAGASDFFDKHFLQDTRFHTVVEKAIAKRAWQSEDARRRRRVDQAGRGGAFADLYGNSAPMLRVKDDIRMVGPRLGMPVLILGPSGAGKERVAHAVHRASGVSGPFVACNVAEIPESLFEGELFGHTKGAFTSAERESVGLVEEANGGTLFLDEIGLLPMNLQGKLLRVLNERKFRKIGGNRHKQFTGRIVCATNEDLEALVRDSKFREDLYYRINGFVIGVPTLNERKEDIPHLAYYFIEQHNDDWKLDPPISTVEPEVWRTLQRHDWTANNVRELRNVMAQAAMRAADEATLRAGDPTRAVSIRLDHLPPHLLNAADRSVGTTQAESPQSSAQPSHAFSFPSHLFEKSRKDAKKDVVDTFERLYVQALLERHDYNVTHAARAADMQRPNFKRLMNRVGVAIPSGDG